MKTRFIKGEKKLLLSTVTKTVIENPVSVKKLITCIKIIGKLSRFGVGYERILRHELHKRGIES